MTQKFTDINLTGLSSLTRKMSHQMQKYPVWCFTGNLGAGKTTCIKEICRHLGVIGEVQSPTFSIVNTYQTAAGETIYHFDCYRLKNWQEALDFGMEEYLFSGDVCLIEWPQVIEQLLPENAVSVHIESGENNLRTFTIEGIQEWQTIQ